MGLEGDIAAGEEGEGRGEGDAQGDGEGGMVCWGGVHGEVVEAVDGVCSMILAMQQ